MIQPWVVLLVAAVYLSILFAVASYGDRAIFVRGGRSRPNIYAFSMAIYCTTWTFFGSVGLAATNGVDFLAIYFGPVLIFAFGFSLLRRIVELSKQERITSVADFLGSRYGKNLKVAGVAALIAVIGTIPYIALQLKAIASSVNTLIFNFAADLPSVGAGHHPHTPAFGDISILVALSLALFSILFGTRHADATEHQHGLMLAIAMESVVKLFAFLVVGVFVTFYIFDGFWDIYEKAAADLQVQEIVARGFDFGNFAILTILSLTVFLLLPRQFHVAVVENNSMAELNRARWLFPLYLVVINIFVIPIAAGGIIQFGGTAKADDFVLLLPILHSNGLISLLAFIGGLSAGTAMVVVACVALAIMISNDIVLPLFLRSRASAGHAEPEDMENRILIIRRMAILGVLAFAYIYYRVADNSAALASIGLISFAAIAQLAPAFFGGLFWKRANARGAMAGMTLGFAIWAYTLLLPTIFTSNASFVSEGLFGISMLRAQNLFDSQFTPLANGVIWSLAFNAFAFIAGSWTRVPDPLERMQASIFAPYQIAIPKPSDIGQSTVRVEQLSETIARYLGAVRTERSLEAYWAERGTRPDPQDTIDSHLLRFTEQLLASAIGASSSRLVHNLLLRRHDSSELSNRTLLDQASKALQFNRDVLQTALDQLEQGITVFDGEFRLASWNRQFRILLNLPDRVGRAGVPLSEIAAEIANANNLNSDRLGEDLAHRLANQSEFWQMNLPNSGEVLEIRTNPMPDGGIVVTWNNITERVQSAKALREVNESLELRVEERTRELERATEAADQANASKTRFLAAAGHDLLQPLNAARLYASTLQDRTDNDQNSKLAENVGRSLSSVEEILGAILAISRLDTASPEVNPANFAIRRVMEQLQLEFDPVAKERGLTLRFVHSSKWVFSDRALLKRLLQNLISNALKFTNEGSILVGCRKRGKSLVVEVIDTGIGMTDEQQILAFREFTRLGGDTSKVPGLGLGLSIVKRIAELLDHEVFVSSKPAAGTRFQVVIPLGEPAIKEVSAVSNSTVRNRNLAGVRILCIDNDLSILDGMKALLEQWDCKVECASSLEEAIKRLGGSTDLFDMLLVDYHLGEKENGIEVVETIRSRFGEAMAAVLVTADRSKEVSLLAKAKSILILNKPVKPAALRVMISRQIQQRQAAE